MQILQCKKVRLLVGFTVFMVLLILNCVLYCNRAGIQRDLVVVIDAGHGGNDPGKIGINDAKEKDINLSIALKLKKLLEKEDIEIVLTRKDKSGLYSAGTSNKKVEDMRKRCDIITDAMPVFTVSIHQNSYTEEYVNGAQVFYFGQSAEGKELAETLQESLREHLDPENDRMAKANESYYLLKKTPTPTVIVECGFLSNTEEANLLITEEYQDKVAEAIKDGILTYLGGGEEGTEAVVGTEETGSTETVKR